MTGAAGFAAGAPWGMTIGAGAFTGFGAVGCAGAGCEDAGVVRTESGSRYSTGFSGGGGDWAKAWPEIALKTKIDRNLVVFTNGLLARIPTDSASERARLVRRAVECQSERNREGFRISAETRRTFHGQAQ